MNDDSVGGKKRKKKKNKADHFLLVGLGASAGGVKALQTFFSHLPDNNTNMAFVVIVHLSEQYESQMPSIIQAKTKMPVIQVNKPVKVQPEHVYVIPPAKQLQLVDGIITLSRLKRTDHINLAIDHFFRTLAQIYGRRAVGIILSGTGSDGTLGLKMIKENNGITMVQDPKEAEHPEMPTSAIETKRVDLVLPVGDMPAKLLQLRDGNEHLQLLSQRENKNNDEKLEILQEILKLIRVRTGADFSHYKKQTLFRRTMRQMQIRGKENLKDYLLLIRENADEIEPLLRSLLINVTQFFRDKDAFAFLEQQVIPDLFRDKTSQDQVRIWVAACSSGEEAYSIAILVAEHLSKLMDCPEVQIFASDLSKEVIAQARAGHFSKGIAINLSEERLKRFFKEEEKTYRISKEIREMVLFTPHNVLGDPPFLRMDLISCRNFLIYLNRAAQEKVLRLFHFALLPSRYLFLGSSESVENNAMLFSPLEKQYAVYVRLAKATEEHAPLILPASPSWQVRMPELKLTPPEKSIPAGELHFRLIEYYASPSVLVNENYEIVHFSESAGRYFRFSGGKSSLHLMSVLLPSLRPDLRTLLFTVRQQQSMAEANLTIEEEGQEKRINLTVYPIRNIPSLNGYFLILFQEKPLEKKELLVETDAFNGKAVLQEMVRKLEDELAETKGRLRDTVEQYETLVEELKASNEELYAVNEEMRSTTEELETSKEELQSVNEELKTVNQELKDKVAELSRSNADLQNLMKATNIGTIFLDRDLKIQLFTPPAQAIFNLIASDIGRPITHITSQLDYPKLTADINEVWQSLQTKERELRSKDGRWYILRIIPYRSLKDRVEGVILTFLDFTERKMVEEAMTEDRLRLTVEAANIGLWEYYPDEDRVKWSESLCELFGIRPHEFNETLEHWYTFIHPEDRKKFKREFADGLKELRDFSLEFRGNKKAGETCWLFFKARVTRLEADKALLVRGAILDFTERKLAEEVLRESDRRKSEFLAILSHELRNPLTPISTALQLMHPDQETEQAEKLQAIISRQVNHMEYLIKELLDVSRIERGKIELHKERVVLQEVVKQALEINQSAIAANQHELKTEIATDPIYLEGDPQRLVQIVHNLLSNAVKYTEPGGQIELGIQRENASAVIRVKDNGIGIPNHQQAQIFKIFVQIKQDKKPLKPGLGIGLRLVKQLVELHGGSVEVRSDGAGTGSEFIVRLPLAARQDAGPAQRNPVRQKKSRKQSVKQRVLVVDDSEDVAFVTAEILKLEGHELTIAHTGEDAIRIALEIRPDVAIIDIGLTDMSGHEVASKIRQSQPDIFLVAYSGLGQEKDRRKALESGFDIHVTKPANIDELASMIAERTGS